jgi:predicted choloylglycine hydrolase
MHIQFDSISELGFPGLKFQRLFHNYWPAYKVWLASKTTITAPDLASSVAALKYYMPEMMPTYYRLCALVNADEMMAKFLTGFQPPAYISACAQAVSNDAVIQLVRNYDYHPSLLEGNLLMTSWNGKKVIAMSDCLIGVLDGMNEDGLTVSLTFGGRNIVGIGFGIPFIMRYVLEFCSTSEEAVAVLIRIPCHMSYNVTVIDRSGNFKTILLSPDRFPVVTDAAFTTNHQGFVDWQENALNNNTINRSIFLQDLLRNRGLDTTTLSDMFLIKPLYNSLFKEGFGTLYTSIYRPREGFMQLRWPAEHLTQSFTHFAEGSKIITFDQLDDTPIVPTSFVKHHF